MVTTVNNTSSTGANMGTTALSSAQEQTDRFLKLLVAQLNNQDPMNPMDNAQMTSQIAQINTVSGIQQLNETMKSMSTQYATMQTLQGATMIGRDVLTEGNTLTVTAGVGKGSVDLSGQTDKTTVQVQTPGGQVLGTINLGALDAGRHSFEWDASSYTGTATPIFKVTASLSGQAVEATPLARSTITSVNNVNGSLNLSLKNGSTVGYDAIKAIL